MSDKIPEWRRGIPVVHEEIPAIEIYRGLQIHAFQSAERIEAVVKPAIDFIMGEAAFNVLFEYALDAKNPPEAREFARLKCHATRELRAFQHDQRPRDLEQLDASTAGITGLSWLSPAVYGSLCDERRRSDCQPVPRPAEYQAEVEAAKLARN